VKGSSLAAATIVIGLIILLVGPLALAVLPTQTYWDDADQAAYEKASTAAHAAAYGGDHDDSQPHAHSSLTDAEVIAKRDASLAELERHNARLKAAQASRHWLSLGSRVLGVMVAAGGVWLYIRARRREP
jgi:hypothetical protein